MNKIQQIREILEKIAKRPDLPNPDRDADWKNCQKWSAHDAQECLVALSELEKELAWMPIETAPRDGNEYLGWFPELNERRVIWWCSAANFSAPLKGGVDGFWNSSHHSVNQPTHWLPLPSPPGGDKCKPESE